MDKERVELRPLRSHLYNEIIAWQGDDQVLRYGVVLSSPYEVEGQEGPGSEESKSSSSARTAGANLIRQLSVRTHPNKVQKILSTRVYSFRATRTSTATSTTTTTTRRSSTPQNRGIGGSLAQLGTQEQLMGDNTGPASEGTNTTNIIDSAFSTTTTTQPMPPVPSDHLLGAVDDILSR